MKKDSPPVRARQYAATERLLAIQRRSTANAFAAFVLTTLLLSPETTQSVLRVAEPDDSDGILSLVLQWKVVWDRRDLTSLPPAWLRLEIPMRKASEKQTSGDQQEFSIVGDKLERLLMRSLIILRQPRYNAT